MEPFISFIFIYFFYFIYLFSVSGVTERFKESISRFPVNFKKIHFQSMLEFIQYGSCLFGIDASNDSAKFQDDWPS